MNWCEIYFHRDGFWVHYPTGLVKTIKKIGSFKLKNYLITCAVHDESKYERTPPVILDVDSKNKMLYIDDTLVVPDNEIILTDWFVISISKIK
jgi:hypothetical protein